MIRVSELHICSATSCEAGDIIIGQDDNEYLIGEVEINPSSEDTTILANPSTATWRYPSRGHVLLTVSNADGVRGTMKVDFADEVRLKKFEISLAQAAAKHIWGYLLCEACGKVRAKYDEWIEDDYVCRFCRDEIDFS